MLGPILTTDYYGEKYVGDLLFNNLGRGAVFHVPRDEMGNLGAAQSFTTGPEFIVKLLEAQDGYVYYVSMTENKIGRWEVRAS